jgi:hypothetical protein
VKGGECSEGGCSEGEWGEGECSEGECSEVKVQGRCSCLQVRGRAGARAWANKGRREAQFPAAKRVTYPRAAASSLSPSLAGCGCGSRRRP